MGKRGQKRSPGLAGDTTTAPEVYDDDAHHRVTGWHVTTRKKLDRYRATGCILPPVRFWRFKKSAELWADKVGRSIILRIEVGEAFPLPDHRPRGHAWWTRQCVRQWKWEGRYEKTLFEF